MVLRKHNRIPESVDVVLVSPPFWDFYAPFLAIPSLAAYLRENGFRVEVVDWNIVFFRDRIFSLLNDMWTRLQDKMYYEHELASIYRTTLRATTHQRFLSNSAFIKEEYFNPNVFKAKFCELDIEEVNTLDALYHLAFFSSFYGRNEAKVLRSLNSTGTMPQLDEGALVKSLNENVGPLLNSTSPPVIGFSTANFDQFAVALISARHLRKYYPDVRIILGGGYVPILLRKFKPAWIKQLFGYFDVVVNGEGETALRLLLESRAGDKFLRLDQIPNIVYWKHGNGIRLTSNKVETVEDLPPPDFSNLDLSCYLAPETILPYQTSRGCFWGKCSFCDHDRNYRLHFRSKSMSKVLGDIEFLQNEYAISHLQFSDEALSPTFLKRFSDYRISENRTNDLSWMAYSRVSKGYTPLLCQRIAMGGGRLFLLGVETFNDRLLDLVHKGTSLRVIQQNLESFKRAGVLVAIWMICGFPTQTEEEMRSDLEKAKELSTNVQGIFAGLFRLEPTSDIFASPASFGIASYDPNELSDFVSLNGVLEIKAEDARRFFSEYYLPQMMSLSVSHNRYILYFCGKHLESAKQSRSE